MTDNEFHDWFNAPRIEYSSREARARALALLDRLGIATRRHRPSTTYHWDGKSLAIRGVGAENLFHEAGHWLMAGQRYRDLPEYGLGPGPEGGPRRGVGPAKTFLRGAVGYNCEQRASLTGVLLEAQAGVEFMPTMYSHDWAWWSRFNLLEPQLRFNDLDNYVDTLTILQRHPQLAALDMGRTVDAFFKLAEFDGRSERELEGGQAVALSETIKKLIPQWMTPVEVDRLRNEFDPPVDRTVFIRKTCSGKNWKRISKETRGPHTERVFDCQPLGDRLRCYVVDDGDGNILEHRFQRE